MIDPNHPLKHPNLWRARQLASNQIRNGHSTGFHELDGMLYDHGWPADGLSELLCDTYGIGELRLLAPALARLSQNQERWIIWIKPPFIPYAPALRQVGINIDKVLLIHPKNHREALWALEQALKTGTASAALAWLNESELKTSDIKRLQIAAKHGKTWTNIFRPSSAANRASMAELRILVDGAPNLSCNQLALTVLKRKGGWPVSKISIELKHAPIRQAHKILKEQIPLWQDNLNKQKFDVETPSNISMKASYLPRNSQFLQQH